ncbi:MAG: hypothetical protein CM15mP86_18790 [Gammaproteobacteria bacterium]|nr:MAG: hypothetical protein CM15mP86_18790 [Gammaproteobacteria bacterium]
MKMIIGRRMIMENAASIIQIEAMTEKLILEK